MVGTNRLTVTGAFPKRLTINAWTGERKASGKVPEDAGLLVRDAKPRQVEQRLFPSPAPPESWTDPEVGWGLILPANDNMSRKKRLAAADAPQPLRELLKARGDAPIFRYYQDENGLTHLHDDRYDEDIPSLQVATGIGKGKLPRYLLIYGTPEQVPWQLQFVLNNGRSVGRLDLVGAALENYVSALLSDWKGSQVNLRNHVVWGVDNRTGDITGLMCRAIAERLYEKLDADEDLNGHGTFINGSQVEATHDRLAQALKERKPAFVATTSHGLTGPLNDPVAMRERLGWLVDHWGKPLDPHTLLDDWEPDGAVWYAHACCSAGGSSTNQFKNLVEIGSDLDRTLDGVAALGSLVASFPQALLGAKKPLRAFIGHVLPTFDWTLKQPRSGQDTTDSVEAALYTNLFSVKPPRKPIGLSLEAYYTPVRLLRSAYYNALPQAIGGGAKTAWNKNLLYTWLVSADIECTVLLGDPAVLMPAP